MQKGALPKAFDKQFTSAVYDASIDAFGNHFSGLFVIKRMEGETFRTVLTTKFGSKLFDFSFPDDADSLIVHECMDELNRPRFISLYKRDISLLLMRDIFPAEATLFRSSDHQANVYRIKQNGTRYFYYVGEQNKNIQQIEQAGFMKGKRVSIQLKNATGMQPSRIAINHNNVDLQVELALIKKD